MSNTLPQYPNTLFPDSKDNFIRMRDVDNADIPLTKQYYSLMNAGDKDGATLLLQQNPQLDATVMNAFKFNGYLDALAATQTVVNESLGEIDPVEIQAEIDGLDTRVTTLEGQGDPTEELEAHEADTVSAADGVHGLRVDLSEGVQSYDGTNWNNVPDGELAELEGEAEEHFQSVVGVEQGTHGFRHHNGVLQYYNPDLDAWVDIITQPVQGIPISTLPVGTTFMLPENDASGNTVYAEYRIVQQGSPDPVLYTYGFDGNTWVERVILLPAGNAFGPNNDYENSTVITRLGNLLNSGINYNLSAIKDQIVEVKIPYKKGTGNSSDPILSGDDGLLTKIFLLSSFEKGVEQSSGRTAIGANLQYYNPDVAVTTKRIKTNNGVKEYWTRDISSGNSANVIAIGNTGAPTVAASTVVAGTRLEYPTFILRGSYQVLPSELYRTYGVSIDLTNSNPETSCTYTDDAVGMTGGSATWESTNLFGRIRPCLLKNGVVQYYLNPANYNQREDGTSANLAGADGDVMVEFPKIGYQIRTSADGNTLTVKITDDPANPDFCYYGHTRVTEGDCDKLYLGAYDAGQSDGKLRSISGGLPITTTSLSQFRTYAQANGQWYDCFSFYPLTLIQCLYIVRFKNLNSQVALGMGLVSGTASTISGARNSNGMFYGTTSVTSPIKCFGLENLWGNTTQLIEGCVSNGSNVLTGFQNFNNEGTGYIDQGVFTTIANGYMVSPHGNNNLGFVTKISSGGSSSSYFCDSGALSVGGNYCPIYGGDYSGGLVGGVFYFRLSQNPIATSSYAGTRLMYLTPAGGA